LYVQDVSRLEYHNQGVHDVFEKALIVLAHLSCAFFMVVLLSGLVPFQHFTGIFATTVGAAAASH